MPMDMDISPDGFGPELSPSPPILRTGNHEPDDKLLPNNDPHQLLPEWDLPNDSAESQDTTSSTSSIPEQEPEMDRSACDNMVEKWRLIKLADKMRAKKKVYPTNVEYAPTFGKNYSKFFEAFRQGISEPEAPQTVTNITPAKRRSEAVSKPATKRMRRDDTVPLPQADQPLAPAESPQRAAATASENSRGAKSSLQVLPPSGAEKPSVRPTPKSDSAPKASEQRSRRKGVGLYAGNWEYATNEERVPEYVQVFEKIADVEGRTTRRAYKQLTSGPKARDPSQLNRSSLGKRVRRSGREYDPIDYARLTNYEEDPGEIAAQGQQQPIDASTAQESVQPSTSTSSTTNRSTSMPNDHSRSTSTSTANIVEPNGRPKLSWNAIVYEILALADGPLTYTEITQDIKNRHPFFKSPAEDKVLKSGLKNPLYFHEAFCKGDIVDGKQTWGLKPGVFVDKKNGTVLTPQPRNPIVSSVTSSNVSSRPAVQVQEFDDPSPVDSTPRASPSNNSRSSNPRFGRAILNSPEIPDSQDPSHTPAEENPLTGRASRVSDTSSPGPSVSDQSAVSPSPRNTLSKRIKFKFIKNPLRFAEAEDESIHQLVEPTDREPSEKASASAVTNQLEQTLVPFIPSSAEATDNETGTKTPPAVPCPKPVVHEVSPTYEPLFLTADGSERSKSPYIISATPLPSESLSAHTQSENVSPEASAVAKEGSSYLQRWA